MGADVTVKGLLGLETGDGGGLGKNDGWLALRGETTITSLELVPAEKKTTTENSTQQVIILSQTLMA